MGVFPILFRASWTPVPTSKGCLLLSGTTAAYLVYIPIIASQMLGDGCSGKKNKPT